MADNESIFENGQLRKVCRKCLVAKHLDDFSAHIRSRDKKQSKCKACDREYKMEHREHIARQRKKHRETQQKQISEQKREYYAANREKLLAYDREYRSKNKEKVAHRKRRYQKENRHVYQRAYNKRRAMMRNLPCRRITDEEYEILRAQRIKIFGE